MREMLPCVIRWGNLEQVERSLREMPKCSPAHARVSSSIAVLVN